LLRYDVAVGIEAVHEPTVHRIGSPLQQHCYWLLGQRKQ
jgi:hypothetical protein